MKIESTLGLSTIFVGGEYEKVDVTRCSAKDMYSELSLS
jgi:hypothetical protein